MKYQKPVNKTDPNASYVNANPTEGVKGSIPPAEAIEHPQREIMSVIEGAALEPNATNLGQLLQAINKIVENGQAELTQQGIANLGIAKTDLSNIDSGLIGTAASKNVGTAANNVVQLDASGKLPAVDGSQLTD
ncbi:MAG: hypothetical protein GY795_43030, partial [Desulfobacterales bacterium]|nr:hypothetical protein [Desulfobacterales bacterium]